MSVVKIDKNGYERGNYSDLIHRQKAYRYIYLKNRDKYPLKFSDYVVHHKDGKKRNNKVSNLELLRKPEHDLIHGLVKEKPLDSYTSNDDEDFMNDYNYNKNVKEIESYSITRKSRLPTGLIIAILIMVLIIFAFSYLSKESHILKENYLLEEAQEDCENFCKNDGGMRFLYPAPGNNVYECNCGNLERKFLP